MHDNPASKPGLTLVTGATGQTGRHIVQSLRNQAIPLRAFFRNEGKANDLELTAQERFGGDLRDPQQVTAAIKGCENLIIAAGASPTMEVTATGERRFRFSDGQRPEDIDYRATRHQVVAAKAAGLRRVILVSSAGVTDPNHRLNQLGDSNLLQWKLKAEDELRQSGLRYVIVRPGRLLNEGEHRRLRVTAEDTEAGALLRSDLAAVCVGALQDESLPSLTFNLMAEAGGRQPDLAPLLRSLVSTD